MGGIIGNPNIREISKKSTGPKTDLGKLKCAVGIRKHRNPKMMRIDQKGETQITRMMKKAKIKFSVLGKAIEARNMFEIWVRGKTMKELTEIQRMDSIIQILDTDMSQRVMEKLEMGISLEEDDIKLIRLLKETLESNHKMKFGEKRLNVNADYKDIRDLMFQ